MTYSHLLHRLVAALCLATAPLMAQSTPVAFTNVTVLPMDGDRRLPNHTVIVQDGRILTMGPSARTPVPAGATQIDGRGKFLMPGLAEMHAHVPPGSPTEEQLADIMFLYVANGITTIRGMLGAPYQIELKAKLASGAMLGPRFFPAAPSLNGSSAPTPEAGVALVRAARATGSDLVKIHPGVSRATWDKSVAGTDSPQLFNVPALRCTGSWLWRARRDSRHIRCWRAAHEMLGATCARRCGSLAILEWWLLDSRLISYYSMPIRLPISRTSRGAAA